MLSLSLQTVSNQVSDGIRATIPDQISELRLQCNRQHPVILKS